MKISFIILLSVSIVIISSRIKKIDSENNLIAQNTNKNVIGKNFSPESFPLPKLENPCIVVKKSQRKLELFDGEKLVKTYKIALGFAPHGDKEKEGDGKTPEGDFYVFTKNDQSRFDLSIGLSYPNFEDAERGRKAKLISKEEYDKIVRAVKDKKMPIQNTALGGEIYIHGGGNSKDWTCGCIALANDEIKEIFDAVPIGISVRIET